METYYIGGYQYGITNYNGTYCVVDCDRYEFADCLDRAIEFTGSYEKCCEYRKQQEISYRESLL